MLFGLSLTLLLFIHIYTWTIFLIFSIILCSIYYALKIFPKRRIYLVFLIIALIIAFDVGRSSVGIGQTAVERAFFVGESREAGLEQFTNRWSNLVRTVQVYVGGIFSNPFFLTAVLIGCTIVSFQRDQISIFVLLFVSLGIIPLFFGDREVMARVFYDIPFQIPAAIGLFFIQGSGSTGKLIFIALLSCIISGSVIVATNI